MSKANEEQIPEEEKEQLKKAVETWINKNPTDFFSTYFFSKKCKPLYRPTSIDRCEKYIGAPDEYLRTMMDALHNFMNWYLNIFETVFLAGIMGFIITVVAVILTKMPISFLHQWWFWFILVIVAFLICIAFAKIQTFSRWLQNISLLRLNLNEIQIEL